MDIKVLKRKSKALKEFDKAQWKLYDQEHFGKDVEWKKATYQIFVQENRHVIGTMELKIEGGVGKINTLIVHNDKQRQGIGKMLIEKATELIKKHGGHKLFLTTGKDWEAARFYKALGFEQVGSLNDHYFHINFIEMSKLI